MTTMQPHERLQQIRCGLNKTPGEVAEQAGVSRAAYYDLEDFPDEIFTSISLRDLQRILTVCETYAARLGCVGNWHCR